MENFTNNTNKMNEQVFQERNLRDYFEIIYTSIQENYCNEYAQQYSLKKELSSDRRTLLSTSPTLDLDSSLHPIPLQKKLPNKSHD